MTNVAVVFTFKSLDSIAEAQGSESWKTEVWKAQRAEYVVMTRNAHNRNHPPGDSVPHRAAFAVGRVRAIVPSSEVDGRWKFECDQIARLDPPKLEMWEAGRRFPVHFTTLEELGIRLDDLHFEPIGNFVPEERACAPHREESVLARNTGGGLTLEAAKAGLAKTFGVRPEQIEITVRG